MRVAILTVSDGCFSGEREDRSGDLIVQWCADKSHQLEHRSVVPDETDQIIQSPVRIDRLRVVPARELPATVDDSRYRIAFGELDPGNHLVAHVPGCSGQGTAETWGKR